jgi:hypothetical protein
LTEGGQQPRLRRALPVIAMATVAFIIGAIVGAQSGSSPSEALASRFVSAWSKGDYATMYSDVDAATKSETSPAAFAAAYREALATATATGVRVTGKARGSAGGLVTVPVRVSTRLFGQLSLPFTLHVVDAGEGARVAWSRSQTFPGLQQGEQLGRRTTLPQRGTLLARDGSVLASGPEGAATTSAGAEANRSSPLGQSADAVLGEVGAVPSSRRRALASEGVPSDALVGLTGLERAFDDTLRGTPGGELLAGSRVLAVVAPRPAHSVRTTISPALQKAAVTALGGLLGGVVVMQPQTGQILAVAGIGLEGVQPPGSTF